MAMSTPSPPSPCETTGLNSCVREQVREQGFGLKKSYRYQFYLFLRIKKDHRRKESNPRVSVVQATLCVSGSGPLSGPPVGCRLTNYPAQDVPSSDTCEYIIVRLRLKRSCRDEVELSKQRKQVNWYKKKEE